VIEKFRPGRFCKINAAANGLLSLLKIPALAIVFRKGAVFGDVGAELDV